MAASQKNLEIWRDRFLTTASPKDPDNFPFLIIANKADLTSRTTMTANKSDKEWYENNENSVYIETSAIEGLNVVQAFEAIARKALTNEKIENFQARLQQEIRLHKPNNQDSSSCRC